MPDNDKSFTAYWAALENGQINRIFAFEVKADVLKEAYVVATRSDARRPGLPENAQFIGVVEGIVRMYRPGDLVNPVPDEANDQ